MSAQSGEENKSPDAEHRLEHFPAGKISSETCQTRERNEEEITTINVIF